jgi:serine/threonine protein kinase
VLTPGTRLGQYQILALIGQGGMGEVYRARDEKLQRDVALKVLHSEVAHDAERVGRFSREATVLASLNHRNVAAIYGLHDDGETPALIMEFVEGPSLADRLIGGPLPVEEALKAARQIADALEAAHTQGIIHRDLKPANVKVRPDGEVKVLDFGIAKALDTHSGESAPSGHSVTVPAPTPLTTPGVLLGTGPYMSPEQARGWPVDRRSDMWAFGVVLWEMLTGRQLFAGATLSDCVAAVLHVEPDFTALPSSVPSPVRRLLRRCLQKDRAFRLDSASVAKLEIDDGLSGRFDEDVRDRPRRTWLPWAMTFLLASALAVVIPGAVLNQAKPSTTASLSAELGADIQLRKDFGPAVIVSPDGRSLAYASEATLTPASLYVRRLDQLVATPLRGSENATNPFFSPDGQWIGFFADGKLKRIAVTGGPSATICDAPSGRGGAWGDDGTIVFAPDNAPQTVLMRVAAMGGTPTPVTTLRPGELSHRWPQVLPGGRGILYTSNDSDNWDNATIVVQPLPTGEPQVVQLGYFGRYLESGHLLYVKGGTLYGAPFDIERLTTSGPSFVVSDTVVSDTSTGGAQYSVSTTGTLVLVRGAGYSPAKPASWMDRGGSLTPLQSDAIDWGNPKISRDGRQLAMDIRDGKQIDVWVQHLETGKLSRLTFDRADDYKPVWTPDGERLVFTSTRAGSANLYWQRADGTGGAERLTESVNAQTAASWHPSGRFLAFQEVTPSGSDVMLLPVATASGASRVGPARPFAAEPSNQTEPVFSPDGRWLAYTSNETGRAEIFVRSFVGGGKWQVSFSGGRDASWSRARSELLYFSTTQNRIMVTSYRVTGESFRVENPQVWSTTQVGRPARSGRTFELHPDGDRVVIVPSSALTGERVTFVFGFFDQIRQLATTAR